jgi:hypothetical protein
METTTMHTRSAVRLRLTAITVAVAVAALLGACKDFLKTTNPSAIDPETLRDSSFLSFIVNGAIGEFQASYPVAVYYNAVFTDELRNTHVFSEEVAYDRRDVDSLNGTFSVFVYTPLQRARWLADSVAGRIRAFEGDSANRDLRYARSLAYAGYGLIALGEMECAVPISTPDRLYSPALPPDSVFAMAIARFDKVIQVATDSRAAAIASPTASTAGTKAIIAGADSIKDLALVGAARAALNMGDKAKALSYATQVQPIPGTTDFQFRVYFNSNTSLSRLNNPMRDRLSTAPSTISGALSGTPFDAIDDARVPYPRAAAGSAAGQPEGTMSGSQVVPNSPSGYSTFDGTPGGQDFDYGGWMRLASLLEAQYIIAEATGPTAQSIAFVESRRLAYPSTTATQPTNATNFMTNLIDQRRRDFYLDGHRIGDLRRYKRFYGLDLWQRGTVPGQTLSFSARECLPLNLAEYQNNPAVRNQ